MAMVVITRSGSDCDRGDGWEGVIVTLVLVDEPHEKEWGFYTPWNQ